MKSSPPPADVQPFETDDLREFLERVASWDSAAWFSYRERYLATYGPLPWLPPICPAALVLQGTLGNRDGRAFGGAVPAEYYARTPAEFLDHARSVAHLEGRRIARHRNLFLSGADLLARPLGDVLAFLKTIGEVFPTGKSTPEADARWDDFPGKVETVHAFLDDFASPLPDHDGWRALRAANLGKVTLGVESGDPTIRAEFGKSWSDHDFRQTVFDLKEAGIGVAVVVLVGLGGSAGSHVEATTSLLGSLPLGRSDLVIMVDVRAFSGSTDLMSGLAAEQMAALKAWASDGGEARLKMIAYDPNRGVP